MNRVKHDLLYSFDEEYRRRYNFLSEERKKFFNYEIKSFYTGVPGCAFILGLILNAVIAKHIGVFVYILIHITASYFRYYSWRQQFNKYYNIVKEHLP